MQSNKSFHFVGAGGIGMSAIARIAIMAGCRVTGSDLQCNYNTKTLEKFGATIFLGHRKENLGDDLTVVYSSAVSVDNPELVEAREKGFDVIHRTEFIFEFFKDKKIIAVTGCHGKTTTVSLLASIFTVADMDPSVVVGGILGAPHNSNGVFGRGEWLILEADESDSTIKNVHSDIAVITNIDDDHMDHYITIDNMKSVLYSFLQNVRPGGYTLLGAGTGADIDAPAAGRYGFLDGVDFQIFNIIKHQNGCEFSLKTPRGIIGDIFIPMTGMHNILNAAAAASAASLAKVDHNHIKHGISSFSGIKKRFTFIGDASGRRFFLDYAHHPTEIIALWESARQASSTGKVMLVAQPHKVARIRYLFNEYVQACSLFDAVILLSVFCVVGEHPVDELNSDVIASEVSKLGTNKVFRADDMELVSSLIFENSSEGDIVVFSGAGDIDCISYEIFSVFKSMYAD